MRKIQIVSLVILPCIVMSVIDAVICPGYITKSAIKMVMFLLIPALYSILDRDVSLIKLLKPVKKGFWVSLCLGFLVYFIILGAYFVFKDIFDFSSLTKNLTKTTGVNKANFLYVAIYISFVNSFLDEFFFRVFSFIALKQFATRRFAYIFSSLMFSIYHIAMMIGWFDIFVILISLAGLFMGGMIFNRFDEKGENIFLSWLMHMFANFATNTIGFILFAV